MIPLCPCGLVMDWVRSCYTTKMRFVADSDRESDVRWFFADPLAAAFPTVHRFASLNWGDRPVPSADDLGEVPTASRPWSNGARPTHAVGEFFCGNLADYGAGTTLLPEPRPLDDEGFPACCSLQAVLALRPAADLVPGTAGELALRPAADLVPGTAGELALLPAADLVVGESRQLAFRLGIDALVVP